MDAIEEVPLIRQKIYSWQDDYFNSNHAIIYYLVLNNITMRLITTHALHRFKHAVHFTRRRFHECDLNLYAKRYVSELNDN